MNHKSTGPSEFTRTLLDELGRKQYRIDAWRDFLAEAWARSLEDIRTSPSLTRSFAVSASTFFLVGAALVLLSWKFYPTSVITGSLVFWLPWYAVAVVFVVTHLGMADSGDGIRHERFSAPNQLSFMRFALAPLVMLPCLAMPVQPAAAAVFALFIAGMSASDILDGWVARRWGYSTRLGKMLDYFADLAFLSFLAVGLYRAAAIPALLLWLLIARYPLSILGALIMYFRYGPVELNPTVIGRVTTLFVSILLLLITFRLLLGLNWPSPFWIDLSVWALQLLIGMNIVYLIHRGMIWARRREPSS